MSTNTDYLTSAEVEQALRPLLDRIKGYYADPASVTDEHAMGRLIAQFFEYDSRILHAAVDAMTDANFHRVATVVDRMREEIEGPS